MNHNSNHNQNERFFVAIPNDSNKAQLDKSIVWDREKKWVQFATLFQGRPITNFKQMYVLLRPWN